MEATQLQADTEGQAIESVAKRPSAIPEGGCQPAGGQAALLKAPWLRGKEVSMHPCCVSDFWVTAGLFLPLSEPPLVRM